MKLAFKACLLLICKQTRIQINWAEKKESNERICVQSVSTWGSVKMTYDINKFWDVFSASFFFCSHKWSYHIGNQNCNSLFIVYRAAYVSTTNTQLHEEPEHMCEMWVAAKRVCDIIIRSFTIVCAH